MRRPDMAQVGLGIALAALLAGCGGPQSKGNGGAGPQQRWSAPPAMALQAGKNYSAVVSTNYGSFTISLFAKTDPVAVNNFVFLARHNFYNGDQFFRIIRQFMVQTGDPYNNGTGGPGYHFADELPPPQSYTPGIVAMANSGPNTNGSQFFICTGAQCANLDQQPNYTEFGKVTSGLPVVEKIAAVPVTTNPVTGEDSMPRVNVHITHVAIHTT